MFATSSFARTALSAAGAALIATACLTVAVAPAAAEATSKTVSYADLNLTNAKGRATLDARIKSAARTVCKADGSTLEARTAETRCIKDAVRNATVS